MSRILCLALLALPAGGQEVLSEEAGRSPGAGFVARVAREAISLHEVDGALVGGGPDYKARFDIGGIEFTPALGSAAPHNFPWRFELQSVRRGEETLFEASSVSPDWEGETVRYDHGGFVERYDILREGIEQSFVFAEALPGEGDLVVVGKLVTTLQLAPGATGGGLEFEAVLDDGTRLGGVAVGAVTGIDALGNSSEGHLSISGETIELSLTDDFVRGASYPLVLDPVISAQVDDVSAGFDDIDPAVSYDQSNSRYLVVWERTFSASNIEIRAQLVSTSGALAFGFISVTSVSGVAFDAAVANVNIRNRFVVAWAEGPLFGPWDVRCATVDASSGTVSSSVLVDANARDIDLSSESSFVDDDAIIVWRSNAAIPGIRAAQVQVSPVANAAPQILGEINLSTDSTDLRPSISKSGGEDGVHLVVWDRTMGAERNIIRAFISRNTTVLSAAGTLINTATLGEERAQCDGDGRNFVVAFQRDESPGSSRHNVWVRPLTWTGNSVVSGAEHDVSIGSADDERNPDIVFDGETYVVAWADETAGGDYDTYAARIDPLSCNVCEPQFTLAVGVEDYDFPALASQYNGGDVSLGIFGFDQTLAAWEGLDPVTTDGQILSVRMTSPGIYSDLGGGCGTAGRAIAPCARTNYADFNHMLTDAPANASAWLIVSFDTLGFACGTCTLIADPFSGFVIAASTDAAGNALVPMSIPNEADLVGVQFIDQWYVPSGNSCTSLSGDLSNALEVTIQ